MKRRAPPTSKLDRRVLTRRDFFRLKKGQAGNNFAEQLSSAEERYKRRQSALSGLSLDLNADLPVAEHAVEIGEALKKSPVVIVAGETGSGKTTQLPKIALQLGLGVTGGIAHTQPRRLAARTVARRIASETGAEYGREVGAAVRFSEEVSEDTLVKVMTDGLLLTEVRSDRFLDRYDVVIVDEAHERSLNIDFLLGYLQRLLRKRKDLKVIITSATIDVERFAAFFDDAPVIEVGGRSYPVDVHYMDPVETDDGIDGIVEALNHIETLPFKGARDVLVFLPGEQQIFNTAQDLRKQFPDRYEVLPLYARLPFAEQRRIFDASGQLRRVVLATNVAETSLTVPNIGYVIDPGVARISRYSYASKLQRLPIEPVSQASADQRKGRCGRVAPGVCIRLYSEEDYLGRAEFTDPEIRRVNLASVVLQMLAFGLGRMMAFPFIDPPDPKAVRDAVRLLQELQALEATPEKLTPLGREMARMPVDPRLARMVVEANKLGALKEILIIVSGLAVVDPRERPVNKRQAADEQHSQHDDERSDFLALVNLWTWIDDQHAQLTRNRFRRALQKAFLNPQRVAEWRAVHRQLKLVSRDLGYRENSGDASYEKIHSAILSGSLGMIARHDERGSFIGARNVRMRIFPGSGVSNAKWLVAGEISETSRVYARCIARVEPRWIEEQGRHILKHQYSEPTWHARRGEVVAYRSSSLYGLRVVERRTVSYKSIDPAVSRELFIQEGLVAGQVKTAPDFLQANLAEMARISELEARGRRRDLLADDRVIAEFYDQRIPADVCSLSDLNHWLRKVPDAANELSLTEDTLLRRSDHAVTQEDFPGVIELDGIELEVTYRFAPGEVDDGVCVTVPVGLLPGVSAGLLEWSVPGFFPKLVEQWLRTLPKQKRRSLVPLPERVDEICARLLHKDIYRNGRLLSVLAGTLRDSYRLNVSEQEWDRSRVDAYLLPYVRVVDTGGAVLAAGRDLDQLKRDLKGEANVEEPQPEQELTGLVDFPDMELQSQVVIGAGNAPRIIYPGLKDDGQSVSLRHFSDVRERDSSRPDAYARLALLKLGKVSTYFRKELDKHPNLPLHFVAMGSANDLKDRVMRSVIWRTFFEVGELPMDSRSFEDRLTANRPALAEMFNQTVDLFAAILELRFGLVRSLDGLVSKAYEPSVDDMRQHLERLVPPDFMTSVSTTYLACLPRYLKGIQRRIENLEGHVPKDRQGIANLNPLQKRLDNLYQAELFDKDRVDALTFLLEEVRLRTFAETVAREKVTEHPLDQTYMGRQWKASIKKLENELLSEEQRVGLA